MQKEEIEKLQNIANILRRDSIIATTAAGSGHPSSCLSCAEIMSCLFFHQMKYHPSQPNNPNNDEFILSKGHAAPILYSALFRAKAIKHPLISLRKLSSPLEGHPMPSSLEWVKVATGSLGQGLSIGLGMALASKLQKRSFKTYVLLGDSEVTEGSIYEAIQLAPHYKLNNLIAILDANRLGQTGPTMLAHNVKEYQQRFKSFGWNTITINGHSIKQILSALKKAQSSRKPTIIIAKTFKGKGVSLMQNKSTWHGKTLDEKQLEKALSEIPNPQMPSGSIKKPQKIKYKAKLKTISNEKYQSDSEVPTREAYGSTLAALAKSNSSVLVLDAEVANSTFTYKVREQTPKQFVQTYIAEQNMIGIALGLSKKGFKVFAASFSSFLSRAHDQLRMSALSSADFTICGSHSGVSIGPDGASQMGLEDIAMFRDLPNSIVLYPSDAPSTQSLISSTLNLPNIKYLRITRPKTKVIYSNNEKFPIGQFKTLKQSQKDKITLIGSGITLHEALKAHALLKSKFKINTAVIDLYCIKPLNIKKLIQFIKQHGNRVVIAEDHYKAGGIGEMLAEEFSNADANIKMKHLYISQIPHSGTTSQLLEKYKINWRHIALQARLFK